MEPLLTAGHLVWLLMMRSHRKPRADIQSLRKQDTVESFGFQTADGKGSRWAFGATLPTARRLGRDERIGLIKSVSGCGRNIKMNTRRAELSARLAAKDI
jgi:hypothetical protein